VEQHSVERYLDNQFYENVNSPKWRDRLRASLGFCHEHAWLAVDKRLGDALGFAIIYHDLVNTILHQLNHDSSSPRTLPRGTTWRQQFTDQVRMTIEKIRAAITARKRCPVCEHREEAIRSTLSVLVKELETPEMSNALQDSDGLCLPHLRLTLEHVKDISVCEKLLTMQRAKLESLRAELAEFIRKNDYQFIQEGFGKEGDAWLRTLGTVVGSRKS
jgi:hypothetical protein